MYCIYGADVYTPEAIGRQTIYISDEKIVAVDKGKPYGPLTEIIDGENLIVVPGFIDLHVHITGAGGEAGMASRTPELSIQAMLDAGITTVGGLLGTDTVTRSLENLLGKARGLTEEGVSAVIYTGGYNFPSPTLTGNIRKDIFLIPEVHGVKLSLADHRSSYPERIEIERILSDVRVGGMLRNKIFQLHIHIGDEMEKLSILHRISENRPHLAAHITATHLNRSEEVYQDGLLLVNKGANMDISTGLTSKNLHADTLTASEAVKRYVDKKLPLSNLTLSSDGNGSAAEYGIDGSIIGMSASSLNSLYEEFKIIVQEKILPLEEALKLITCNPAVRLGLDKKGKIAEGMDADILLLRKDLSIHSVIARGKCIYKNKDI